MADEKLELKDDNVRVAGQDGASSPVTGRDDSSLLEKQTRTRRLFSTSQLFFFSMMYFVTWLGIGSNMYYSLLNGGPIAYLFNYLIVVSGVLAQSACLAELASIIPIAGAQYYWTHHYCPPKYRKFVTWIQGWVTWLGYVAGLASVINANSVNIEAAVQINFTDYVNGGWHTTLIVMTHLAFYTIVNVWFFVIVPWFEFATGIINICFFFITLVTLWVMSPRNSPDFLLTRTNFSGWDNDFLSWNIGMLTQIWMFIGMENVIHMGEETKHAKRAVPQAMFWSVACSAALGFVMVVTYLICMPPVEDMIMATNPFVYLVTTSTGSRSVSSVLVTGFAIVSTGCGMSSFSSTTRLTWAWARDGGLPSYFGLVDGKSRVPIRAVLFTCLLVTLLALLNLGSSTYVALGAITSLCSIALYFSYLIILSVTLNARLTGKFQPGEWSMGRAGLYIHIYALVYTVYTIIWLPFPTTVPVTASNMNYSGPVFLAVMIGAITMWIFWANKNWPGPNKGVVDIVLRLASTR